MSEDDEEYHIGMAIHNLMGSLTMLAEIVETERGRVLVHQDASDLELAQAILGKILRYVHAPIKEAAA